MAKTKQYQPEPTPSTTIPSNHMSELSFFDNSKWVTFLLLAISFLLYANTLQHGFVLDDFMVIKHNSFTKEGIGGIWDLLTKDSFHGYYDEMNEDTKAFLVTGGRYRPLSMVCFAIIYQLFGENTFVFHLFTILLFAATCVVLYRTLILMFKTSTTIPNPMFFAFASTLLFAAHPIHTEVVANIKGCDEILALLGSLATLFYSFKAWDTGEKKYYWAGIVSFFLACMAKENSITFLAVIPLALWFFRGRTNHNGYGYSKLGLGLFGAFLLFFFIRSSVLHWHFGNQAPMELMNNPFIKYVEEKWIPFTSGEKFATIMVTLGKYIWLLIFPHPLTHDYYPRQIGIMNMGNLSAIASLVFYLGIAFYVFKNLAKRSIYSFGIFYFLLTFSIVSNFFFPVGTLMNERFVFMPSVGFCIIIIGLLIQISNLINPKKAANLTLFILLPVILLYSFKTFTRNQTWVSNEKLFLEDVKISTQSGKAHDDAGGILFSLANKETDKQKKQNYYKKAIEHFDFALKVEPNYRHALMHRAASYHLLEDYTTSINQYRQGLKFWPQDAKVKKALAMSLRDLGQKIGQEGNDLETARTNLGESIKYNDQDGKTFWLMAVCYAKENKFELAKEWFNKAIALEPKNAGYLYDLGITHARLGDNAKSGELFKKATEINPNIAKSRINK